MPSVQTITDRLEILCHDQTQQTSFEDDVRNGLSADPKRIPSQYIYNEAGSILFEEICAQPEYYLTAAERAILQRYAGEIAASLPSGVTLVELGSGSSVKTRLLIDALIREHGELRYVPIDVSKEMLVSSSQDLLDDFDQLEVVGIAGDYSDGVAHLREDIDGPRCVAWLGSSIGNLDGAHARNFLRDLVDELDPDDRLLIGMDLKKDIDTLEQAYDDAKGVSRRFNENILLRMNDTLGADFNIEQFEYRARYNHARGRIEMVQVSRIDQSVRIEELGLDVDFKAGEIVHIEYSHKYSQDDIEKLSAEAGFAIERQWFDDGRLFSLNSLRPVAPA